MTDTASYPKAAHRCLTHIGVRTARNILRVAHFLRFSSDLRSDRDANDVKAYTGDAFRASVVFMHAILEDTLREIARLKLEAHLLKSSTVFPSPGLLRSASRVNCHLER